LGYGDDLGHKIGSQSSNRDESDQKAQASSLNRAHAAG
jgi:hypothetical protein